MIPTGSDLPNARAVHGKYCIYPHSVTNEARIDEFESTIRSKLPPDYRAYLRQFNGGGFNDPTIPAPSLWAKEDGLTSMFGLDAPDADLNNEIYLSLFDPNPPPVVLAIGYTCMGNLLFMDLRESRSKSIVRMKLAGRYKSYLLSKSLEEFFGRLTPP